MHPDIREDTHYQCEINVEKGTRPEVVNEPDSRRSPLGGLGEGGTNLHRPSCQETRTLVIFFSYFLTYGHSLPPIPRYVSPSRKT